MGEGKTEVVGVCRGESERETGWVYCSVELFQ